MKKSDITMCIEILRQYAKESGTNVRSTSDLSPLEEWLLNTLSINDKPNIPDKIHRHKDNPLEAKLFDAFMAKFMIRGDIDVNRIVLPVDGAGRPEGFLTDREVATVINTIQWLGSPVGRTFLRDVGFEYNEKDKLNQ